jgi:hypothetical protein
MTFQELRQDNILALLVVLLTASILLLGCSTVAQSSEQPATPTIPEVTSILPTPTAAATPTAVVTATSSPTRPPATPTARPIRIVKPESLGGYISNPYMGWQDTQPKKKRFAETVSYKRMDWSVMNPAEDVYDWSIIDSLQADAVSTGRTISFRIRTARPAPYGEGQTMPAWLVQQGATIVEGDSDVENVRSTEPLYSGCLFLEEHGRFIEAMRQRYDGDPNIAFIDIGSYGGYGEWHSEQYDEEPDSLDWHARRRIVDMYLGGQGTRPCQEAGGQIKQVSYEYTGFQKTPLVMPFTPWFGDSLIYALSRRPDLGIRHDALGSEKHQRYYREQISQLVAQTWPHAPIIFEFYPNAYQPEQLRSARDFARDMHASIVHDNFDGQGRDKLIEEVLDVIGYRLVLREMSYTAELGPGETLSFTMTWENTGVAPPYYKTYPLVVSLTDAQGKPVLNQQLEPDIRTWLPAKPINQAGMILIPADFPYGDYDLTVAFIDPASQKPILNLAIAGRDEQGRYFIGPVNISR